MSMLWLPIIKSTSEPATSSSNRFRHGASRELGTGLGVTYIGVYPMCSSVLESTVLPAAHIFLQCTSKYDETLQLLLPSEFSRMVRRGRREGATCTVQK
jgi:hypothetical protein